MNTNTFLLTAGIILLSMPGAHGAKTEASSRQIRDRVAKVRVESVDVVSGPAAAYSRRGRVYRGDVLTIRGEPGATWVEIVSGEIKGWVPLSTLTIIPYAQTRTEQDGKVDAGRDRRETNYSYDKQGRRIRSNGALMGSGEGTTTPEERVEEEKTAYRLFLDLGVGVGQVDRRFYSNAFMDSPLYGSTVSPLGLATSLNVRWVATPWLTVEGGLQDVRLGSSRVTAAPLNGGEPIEIDVDSQTAFSALHLQYPLKGFLLGGFAGLSFFRTGFQETKPVPLFLDTLLWNAVTGGSVAYALGQLELALRVGVLAPISVDQAPKSSGDADGSGHHVNVQIRWWIQSGWAVTSQLTINKVLLNYSGEGDHIDTVTDGGPYAYTQARESTQIWSIGLGVSRAF